MIKDDYFKRVAPREPLVNSCFIKIFGKSFEYKLSYLSYFFNGD